MSILELSRAEGAEHIRDPIYQLENVDCLVNQKTTYLKGSLYLLEELGWFLLVIPSNIVFLSNPKDDHSLVFEYTVLGVHAVCHEPDIFKRPCIYCQISEPSEEDGCQEVMFGDPTADIEDSGDEEEEEDTGVFEILFSPEDESVSRFEMWS